MEKVNFRNISKCNYNDKGFCKFRDECRKQHFNTACEIQNCDKQCRGRHPKPCKNKERCRFFAKHICAYKHDTLGHDDAQLANLKTDIENLKYENERKLSEIAVIKKELKFLKCCLENDNNDRKEESNDLRNQIESLKKLNDELLKENEHLNKVNIDLGSKLDTKVSSNESEMTNETLEEEANIGESLNCKMCNFRARSHPGLKTHITAKHTVNRKFGLQNKKNTITNNHDVESICEECDETFSTKSELEIHLNILHTIRSKDKPEESQDKDYSCEKCDKSFDEK